MPLLQYSLVSRFHLCCSSTDCGSEKATWSGPSHQCGSNPHCIFLFLLTSVSFDSSVLLDFLISSETCFLEYFVRYLKLLKSDWPQFCLVCSSFDQSRYVRPSALADVISCPQLVKATQVLSECVRSPNQLSSTPMDISCPASSAVSHSKHSTPSRSGCVTSSLGALHRLVDYDSSEGSESECADTEHCAVIVHCAGADSTDIDKRMNKLELKAQCPLVCPSQSGSYTCHIQSIQQRAVQCLEDLQEAINRLHRKKLFPYNPSALLRLLLHVTTLNENPQIDILTVQPTGTI